MRFLADESCDAAVSRALRAAGHDVKSVGETSPGATDRVVLSMAVSEERILLTEDKDFGSLVFESRAPALGVVLIRFPATMRSALPKAIRAFVDSTDSDAMRSFVVLEPAGARVSSLPHGDRE